MSIDENGASTAIRVLSGMGDIARSDWDACANPGWPSADPLNAQAHGGEERPSYNPFLSWDFLDALEASGSAQPRTGWAPLHLALDGADGRTVGVVPCYLKSHSQGEYVFDHAWADAYERAGGDYYPKLQASVPFTPVPGRRLLVRPAEDAERNRLLLAAGLAELCRLTGASSTHATFLTEEEWALLASAGWLRRTDQQFHWRDEGYGDFDGFLAALASRKRKQIRKEREEALASGLTVEPLRGGDITEAHWDAFFRFYMDTGSRKWGRPYLNRRFFSLLGERMADRVLLVMAMRGGRPVAGALNLIGSDTLYGRYWGALEEHPCLHFEVCYYQAIDYALAHGLTRVEAGAQGAHKLARGYVPTITYSAHFIPDANFRRAVDDYLKRERRAVEAENRVLAEHAPFRRSG